MLQKELERLSQAGADGCGIPQSVAVADESTPEIVFAISLKSRNWANDWERVKGNLARTLRSIWRQSGDGFRAIVATHEQPDIPEVRDPRCTLLEAPFPVPMEVDRLSSDKVAKRKLIGSYLRKEGYSGYVMALDADDLLHRHFVTLVRPYLDGASIVFESGFVLDMQRRLVWGLGGTFGGKSFFKGCGSCSMVYLNEADLPVEARGKMDDTQRFRFLMLNHTTIDETLIDNGERLLRLQDPLVTWVQGHGDNNSLIKGKHKWSEASRNEEAISEQFLEAFAVENA